MRRLNRTILSGGVMYPAGQAATPELEAAITNPAYWDDDMYVEPAPVAEPPATVGDPPPEAVDYSTWEYDALVAQVKARNDQRDDEHHIRPASRKAEDLAAALAADDQAYPA